MIRGGRDVFPVLQEGGKQASAHLPVRLPPPPPLPLLFLAACMSSSAVRPSRSECQPDREEKGEKRQSERGGERRTGEAGEKRETHRGNEEDGGLLAADAVELILCSIQCVMAASS